MVLISAESPKSWYKIIQFGGSYYVDVRYVGVFPRGIAIAQRSVSNLLEGYDELLAVSLTDNQRLRKVIGSQKRVILAIDGLQPEVGHEVLWVIRDCLSGEILLARTMLSSRGQDE